MSTRRSVPVGLRDETSERDALGIIRSTDADHPWPAVPTAFADAVVNAASAEDVVTAMTLGEDRLVPSMQHQLLHPAGGAAALLVPVRQGQTALDLGTGWSTLPSALGSLGATVVSADWRYARLRFGQLMYEPAADAAVHIALGRALPFDDDSFDHVFADLDEIDDAADSDAADGCDRGQVLAEVHRVLTDGGTAVFGMRARRWHREGRVRVPAPDRVRSFLTPWREHELRRAGFTDFRVVAARPRRSDAQRLIPLERLRHELVGPGGDASLVRTAKRSIGALGARLGGGRWMVEGFYVLARRRPDRAGGTRLLAEELAPFTGGVAPVIRTLSDARVAIAGSGAFVKFPLSEDQQRAIVTEVDKTGTASTTAFAPFTVDPIRVEQWHGIPYAVYPLIQQRADATTADAVAAVRAALDAQQTDDAAPFRTTALWQRITSARGQRDIAELGAGQLYEAVVTRCSDLVVPVGPTHGDLHPSNVVLPTAGSPLLVDWNRFEPRNPLFLDAAYAAVRSHQRAHRVTLAPALLAFADGVLHDPLAVRAVALLGDLLPFQAATLVLLDRIVSYSKPRRRYKPWTMGPLDEATRALTSRIEDRPADGRPGG